MEATSRRQVHARLPAEGAAGGGPDPGQAVDEALDHPRTSRTKARRRDRQEVLESAIANAGQNTA